MSDNGESDKVGLLPKDFSPEASAASPWRLVSLSGDDREWLRQMVREEVTAALLGAGPRGWAREYAQGIDAGRPESPQEAPDPGERVTDHSDYVGASSHPAKDASRCGICIALSRGERPAVQSSPERLLGQLDATL